ncbi:MAG: hypothetical protein HYU64_02195 [Armatimonadetes bacterium]|nr:hypothetical protein [Armatimonadota bacterium]
MPKIRTQIQLEKGQYERLKEESFRRRQSLSAVIRLLIDKGLEASGRPKKVDLKKAMAFVGAICGDQPDVAARHDAYLAKIYAGRREK